MALWILKANGNVVPHRSSRPLKVKEVHSAEELKKSNIFDALIVRRWGTSITLPTTKDSAQYFEDFTEYEDDNEVAWIIPDVEEAIDVAGKYLNQLPAYDLIINS